jgi:hypothetical protein
VVTDEYVEQRVKNLYFVIVFFGLIVYGFEFLAGITPLFFIPMVFVAGFVYWYIFRFFSTPCPSCNKSFFTLFTFWRYATLRIKRCSKCKYELKNS